VVWNRADPVFDKQASYCTPVRGDDSRKAASPRRDAPWGSVSLDPKTGTVNFSFWFRARQNDTVNAMAPIVSGATIFPLSGGISKWVRCCLRVKPDGKISRGSLAWPPALRCTGRGLF
jgi:hypothetical protein